MRNYPPFPGATPHQKAGSPRVPHPSATRTPESATFDLHALGTPPALILSQDQTLHQVCPLCPISPQPEGRPSGSCSSFCVRWPTHCFCSISNPYPCRSAPITSFEQLLHLRQASSSPTTTPHNR